MNRSFVEYEYLKEEEQVFDSMVKCSSSFFEEKHKETDEIRKLTAKYSEFGRFLCAKINNETVGFCAYYANSKREGTAYISIIAVRKEMQGMGIGSALLEKTISDCKKEQMRRILLEVNKNNKKAMRFYIRHGFCFVKQASNKSVYYERMIK